MHFPVANPFTYYTPTFPPGQNRTSFVRFGQRGQASVEQGNYWPINLQLRSQLIRAETDAHSLRSTSERLTYRQVLQKYDTWDRDGGLSRSTMRYHNRKFTNPVRDRVAKFKRRHIGALRRAVPLSQDAQGRVAWKKVCEAVQRDTDKKFGLATLGKRWEKMTLAGQGEGYEGPDVSDSDGGAGGE